MQANKDQDWTDDAAFWDEAWADMNTRLDAEPNHKKGGLAWWWLYIGVAATVLFALLLGAGIIFVDEDVKASPPASAVIASVPADKFKAENEIHTAFALIDETRTSPTELAQNKLSAEQAKSENPIDYARETTALVRPEASSGGDVPFVEPASDKATKAVIPTAPPSGPKLAALPTSETVPPPPTKDEREKIAASLQLGPTAISPLPADLALTSPSVTLQRHRKTNAFLLDAGLSSSYGFQNPGFYAGAGYRIKNRTKLSFPLTLRYRYDQLSIKEFPGSASDQLGTSVDNPIGSATGESFTPVSIRSSAVEVGAGLAIEATSRLRFSTGLSAAYQLRAILGVNGVNPTELNAVGDFVANEDYRLQLDRGFNLLSAQNRSQVNPDYSSWAFRAKLGVAYDLNPRLGLNLKATHLILQPDRAQVIGVQTGQLEFGLSYRLW